MIKIRIFVFLLILLITGGIMFSIFRKSNKNQNSANSASSLGKASLMDDSSASAMDASLVEKETDAFGATVETSPADTQVVAPSTSSVEYDANKKYTVTLKTTAGDITISLNKDQTPKTVENFVTLSAKGFYNGTTFHRVVKGFMIQGGCPEGTGMGGPGYKFDDEPFTGEYKRGTVAMANSGPNTNGSQFFIMHADYPLPKNYVIFGTVTQGMEVVDAIANAPVVRGISGELSKPVEAVSIVSVEVSSD
ncbi:MAG TPA: peptidylprolyl isomerase [bacterium]|nr:peptidylprolyl isomerase [bacterium]